MRQMTFFRTENVPKETRMSSIARSKSSVGKAERVLFGARGRNISGMLTVYRSSGGSLESPKAEEKNKKRGGRGWAWETEEKVF